MSTPSPQRLHALDSVRALALIFGIFFHASFSFFPGDPFWMIMDSARSTNLSVLAFTFHIFRMTTFFLLAGFFGHMQFHRLGAGRFIKDRMIRIGAPLVIFWPIMMMLFIGLIIWAVIIQNGGTMPTETPEQPAMTWRNVPLTHLWFLYILLIFYGVMIIWRTLVALLDRGALGRGLFDRTLASVWNSPLLLLLLAAPTAFGLYTHPNWFPFFGIPTPEYGLIPNRAAMIAYGTAFALGWALHRQTHLLANLAKGWMVYLAGATVLTCGCLYLIGLTPTYVHPLHGWTLIAYIIAYALAIWCWTFGLIGVAMAFASRFSRVQRYLADSSYWLYLMHLPLVIALQIWVFEWPWPAELKYGFILVVTFAVLLGTYQLLVRNSFLGALLNGRRKTMIVTPDTERS